MSPGFDVPVPVVALMAIVAVGLVVVDQGELRFEVYRVALPFLISYHDRRGLCACGLALCFSASLVPGLVSSVAMMSPMSGGCTPCTLGYLCLETTWLPIDLGLQG